MSSNSSVKTASIEKNSSEKKKLPTIAIVGIGCVGILILAGIVMSIAGKMLFSKFGSKIIGKGVQNVIEQKTGVKIEANGNGEVVSFMDKETGSEVNIGSTTVPDGFPKDFPLYPGAKPIGNVSGQDDGYWLMMESGDTFELISSFYVKNLKSSGWVTEESMSFGTTTTWKVKKGTYEGSVVVNKGENNDKKITILITLNKHNPDGE